VVVEGILAPRARVDSGSVLAAWIPK